MWEAGPLPGTARITDKSVVGGKKTSVSSPVMLITEVAGNFSMQCALSRKKNSFAVDYYYNLFLLTI